MGGKGFDGSEMPCKCGAAMWLISMDTTQRTYTFKCVRCKRRVGVIWDEMRVRPKPDTKGEAA